MDDVIPMLAEAFALAGFEFFLVGGTVRDGLLGRDAHDLDATTNARPEESKAILEQVPLPLHLFAIGEKFGTIGAIFPDGMVVEVTTYRAERYPANSRKPLVFYGDSLQEDLARRDFTINAIAQDPLTGELADPSGGQDDLKLGLIRCVGDARERFREDPLRMLRAARFAAQLGFTIDETTRVCMAEEALLLEMLSRERVRDEVLKLVLAREPERGFQVLRTAGLLAHILPEIERLTSVSQLPYHTLDAFDHTMLVVKSVPARQDVRLAALLHDIGKPATHTSVAGVDHFYEHEDVGAGLAYALLHRLRFPGDVCRRVAHIVQLHMRVNSYEPSWSPGAVRRLRFAAQLLDGDVWDDLLALAAADQESDRTDDHTQQRDKLLSLRVRAKGLSYKHGPQSPLNGDELCAIFGKKPGPWIRDVKNHLTELVLDDLLEPGDKEQAEQRARLFLLEHGAFAEGRAEEGRNTHSGEMYER